MIESAPSSGHYEVMQGLPCYYTYMYFSKNAALDIEYNTFLNIKSCNKSHPETLIDYMWHQLYGGVY